MNILPGDVALTILSGSTHTEHMRESLREELGLNDPLPVRYATWLLRMISGELGGESLETGEPIGAIVATRLPVSLGLTIYAVFVSVIVAVPLGLISALRANHIADYTIRLVSLGGLSFPHVWISVLVLLGLLKVFQWSPPVIYERFVDDAAIHIQMMIWPTLILAWGYSSHLIRVTRASVLDSLSRDYTAAARSRGLSEVRIVMRYSIKNSIGPILTVAGLQFGTIIGGVLVLETIFGLPGIGRVLVQAATARDVPVVMSLGTLLVGAYIVLDFIVDLFHAMADPRAIGMTKI